VYYTAGDGDPLYFCFSTGRKGKPWSSCSCSNWSAKNRRRTHKKNKKAASNYKTDVCKKSNPSTLIFCAQSVARRPMQLKTFIHLTNGVVSDFTLSFCVTLTNGDSTKQNDLYRAAADDRGCGKRPSYSSSRQQSAARGRAELTAQYAFFQFSKNGAPRPSCCSVVVSWSVVVRTHSAAQLS